MTALLLFARSRLDWFWWPVLLVATVLCCVVAQHAVTVDIVSTGWPRAVPLFELFPALAGIVLASLCRPVQWVMERFADLRLRRYVASSAVMAIAVPALMVVVAAPFRPRWGEVGPGLPWSWIGTNVVTVTAIALLAAVLFGGTFSWSIPLAFFTAVVSAQHLRPHSWPAQLLASPGNWEPRWSLAGALTLVAVSVCAATGGASTWSTRRLGEDVAG